MPFERIVVHPPAGLPRQIVVDYLDRCRASLLALQSALAKTEFDSTRVLGHRMKGSGGGYGIPRLTEIGAGIEQAAKNQDSGELQRQIAALGDFLNQVEVAAEVAHS